jgi:hypothetical protein
MSVLNLSDNIKVGSLQVDKVFLGTDLIWPSISNSIIRNIVTGELSFSVTTNDSSDMTINWGDGDTTVASSSERYLHIYGPVSLWTFNSTAGAQISGLNIIFTGSADIDWGDNTTNALTSNAPINHTY